MIRLLAALVLAGASVRAETISITASAMGAAYFQPNGTYIGGVAQLGGNFLVSEGFWNQIYHTWIKFDLSQIPDGSLISSAQIKFRVANDSSPKSRFEVFRSSFDSWSAPSSGSTNVSFPYADNGLISLSPMAFSQATYNTNVLYSLSLDPSLSSWGIDLTDNVLSLQLKPTGPLDYFGNQVYISGNTNTLPTLEVSYVPEPSSLSLFLAGGALLMAGRRRS